MTRPRPTAQGNYSLRGFKVLHWRQRKTQIQGRTLTLGVCVELLKCWGLGQPNSEDKDRQAGRHWEPAPQSASCWHGFGQRGSRGDEPHLPWRWDEGGGGPGSWVVLLERKARSSTQLLMWSNRRSDRRGGITNKHGRLGVRW